MIESNSEFLTMEEAAKLINVGFAVIRNAIYRNELVAQRIGPKLIRIKKEDLNNWIVETKNKKWNSKKKSNESIISDIK